MSMYRVFIANRVGVYGYTADDPPRRGTLIELDGNGPCLRVLEVNVLPGGDGSIYGELAHEYQAAKPNRSAVRRAG